MVEPGRLDRYPIIGDLDANDRAALLPFLRETEFDDGAVILKQGQTGDRLYILLEGALDVLVEKEPRISVAKLKPGSIVGEMSCLTGSAISATVQAMGRVRTVSMPRDGLLQLMDRSAAFRSHMIEAMSNRIRESNERVLEEYTRSFVVMKQFEQEKKAQYGPLVGGSRFMRHLREQIRGLAVREDPVCIVGERGSGKSHLAAELHSRSNRSGYPLVIVDGAHGDDGDGEWELKRRAAKHGTMLLEQADELPPGRLERFVASLEDTRLIMTARSTARMKMQAQELRTAPLRERKEDIPELVHEFLAEFGALSPEDAISQEAMHLLVTYPYLGGNIRELKQIVKDALVISGGRTIRNTHLRFGSLREPGARPRIGLALGSGSVRGAAHVGVLKALEEAEIPIDAIAGTSVGAFIGALYAGGQPIRAFESVLPTVRWRQLVRFAVPPRALANNAPMARFVEKYIGPVDFDDLPIPFAAVASDAVSGEAYILNTGRVSRAICASTAIPGVMEPVRYDGRLLVDGAVVHPVPVALAKSLGADIVIAVDLSLPPFRRRAPKHFIASILNTMEMMSQKIVQEELQLADIVLNPHLEQNTITFKASSAYIRIGEKAAREALADLRRAIDGAVVRP